MGLNVTSTATQIDGMAGELKASESDRKRRLDSAFQAIRELTAEQLGPLEAQNDAAPARAAVALEPPGATYAAPPPPSDFTVAAVDGSHIDVDRHLPVRCFVINTGVAALTYGARPDAHLSSDSRLYAGADDLVISDPATYRQQAIEGAVLSAKRTVEEMRALVELVQGLPPATPTLALVDGPLMMLGLVGALNQEFVLQELVEDGFAAALNELRELGAERRLAVAGYISLPRSSEVTNALRMAVCPYVLAEPDYRCSMVGQGLQRCDRCVEGVLDREVFARLLDAGERSALFGTSSAIDRYYRDTAFRFFYIAGSAEVGRVEIPSWVAEDEDLLALTHAVVFDQCVLGRGYPVALMEAHEQAVISGRDRAHFVELVERALYSRDVPVYTSEKARSKRLRWL